MNTSAIKRLSIRSLAPLAAASIMLSLIACSQSDAQQDKMSSLKSANSEVRPAHVIAKIDYQAPQANTSPFSDKLTQEEITKVATAVADWQLAQFDIRSNKMRTEMRPSGIPNGWMYAPLHLGLWHWAEATDTDLYRQTVINLSLLNDYQLAPRVYHADDHAVGAVYLAIYNKYKGEHRIANTIAHFDEILAKPSMVDLHFDNQEKETHRFPLRNFTDPKCTSRWCWADAVFMSPPVMAHLSKTTGDDRYVEFMDKEFWAMTEYLFDKDYGLYLRDSRYFELKDEQGRPIFWGRGNGWVLAGLARTIEHLPAYFTNRQAYVDLFTSMSKTLLDYQLEDGSWPSSLLEKNADTHSETSATGLLAYAFAWGINNGHLKGPEYRKSVDKAWQSIVANIYPDGKVGYVQQVAFAPGSAQKQDTQLYGSGAVLLAAAEIYTLLGK